MMRLALRLAAVMVAGLLATGCSKCGDFTLFGPKSCHQDAPR